MTEKTLKIEDLRIDPDKLREFTDQFVDPPSPASKEWKIPELKITDDISIRVEWDKRHKAPEVRLEIGEKIKKP